MVFWAFNNECRKGKFISCYCEDYFSRDEAEGGVLCKLRFESFVEVIASRDHSVRAFDEDRFCVFFSMTAGGGEPGFGGVEEVEHSWLFFEGPEGVVGA